MKGGSEIYGKKTRKEVRKDKCRKRRKNRKKYNFYKIDDRQTYMLCDALSSHIFIHS